MENMFCPSSDGKPQLEHRNITVTLKDGEIVEYFWPTHENDEQYGLRKGDFSEEVIYENGSKRTRNYTHLYTAPVSYNKNYIAKYGVINPNNIPDETILDSTNNQVITQRSLAEAEGIEQFRNSILTYKGQVEGYLPQLVQYVEDRIQDKSEPYFEVVPQYNSDEVKLEEEDLEGFVLYGIKTGQLCISMQRMGDTGSVALEENLKKCSARGKIYCEKFLEGGFSSRSFYYGIRKNNFSMGLGISSIDPNAIIGFHSCDAQTSMGIKDLFVRMQTSNISYILDSNSKGNGSAELATLRYEYDISKIMERNCRR